MFNKANVGIKMRGLTFILLLVPLLGFSQIKKQVDEVTGNQTLVSENPILLDFEEFEGMEAKFMTGYTADTYLFAVYSLSDDGIFLDNDRISFWIDGYKLDRDIKVELHYDNLDKRKETAFSTLNRSDFDLLANARILKFNIGTSVFSLSHDKRENMRLILQETTE